MASQSAATKPPDTSPASGEPVPGQASTSLGTSSPDHPRGRRRFRRRWLIVLLGLVKSQDRNHTGGRHGIRNYLSPK